MLGVFITLSKYCHDDGIAFSDVQSLNIYDVFVTLFKCCHDDGIVVNELHSMNIIDVLITASKYCHVAGMSAIKLQFLNNPSTYELDETIFSHVLGIDDSNTQPSNIYPASVDNNDPHVSGIVVNEV